MRPRSILGRDPPDKATVNLPFFSMDSFCAWTTKAASDSTMESASGKEQRIAGCGAGCAIVVYNVLGVMLVSSAASRDHVRRRTTRRRRHLFQGAIAIVSNHQRAQITTTKKKDKGFSLNATSCRVMVQYTYGARLECGEYHRCIYSPN